MYEFQRISLAGRSTAIAVGAFLVPLLGGGLFVAAMAPFGWLYGFLPSFGLLLHLATAKSRARRALHNERMLPSSERHAIGMRYAKRHKSLLAFEKQVGTEPGKLRLPLI